MILTIILNIVEIVTELTKMKTVIEVDNYVVQAKELRTLSHNGP